MVSYKGLEINSYSTDNIEPLFKAMYFMSRTPDCEEVAADISKLLSKEFMKFPEVKDSKNQRCRRVENIKYYPNGMVQLQGMLGYTVMAEPWEPELPPHEPEKATAPETAKAPSYTYLKKLNPIWYAQVMKHLGRKFAVHKKNRVDFQGLFDKQAIYESLTDEEKDMIGIRKITDAISEEAKKLHDLFSLNNYYANLRWSQERHEQGLEQLTMPQNAFFFLTDDECQRLADAMDKDGIGRSREASLHSTPYFSAVLADMLVTPPEDRVWVMRPKDDDIAFIEERQYEGDEGRYYYRNTYRHQMWRHEEIREFYNQEFEDLSEDHLHLLKRFGILVEKPETSEDSEES